MPPQNVQNSIAVIVQQTFVCKVLLYFYHLSVVCNTMIHRTRVSNFMHHRVQQLLTYSKKSSPAKTVEGIYIDSFVRHFDVNTAVLLVY